MLFSFPRQAQAKSWVERWYEADHAAVDLILAGENGAAVRKLDRVVKQMVKELGPGVGGEQVLAWALMHRALAEVGLGRTKDAFWDWQIALNLYPSLADRDMSQFGEAGRFLESNVSWVPPSPADEEDQEDQEEEAPAPRSESSDIQPPKPLRRIKPDFPYGAKYFHIQGPIIVQMIIGRDGEVRNPTVLKDLDAAAITYSVFEAIRKMKFRPALLDGKPVAVYYNLTFNYRLR